MGLRFGVEKLGFLAFARLLWVLSGFLFDLMDSYTAKMDKAELEVEVEDFVEQGFKQFW